MTGEATLVFEDGTRFPVPEAGATIGRRADSDLVLTDPETSRRHAQVFYREGSVYVTDLGSMNGTFVNGAAVAGEQVLTNGDVIQLGDTKLTTQIEAILAPASDVTDLEAPVVARSAVISLHEPVSDSASGAAASDSGTARLTVRPSEPTPGPSGSSVEVALTGVLDIETADQFRGLVDQLLEAGVAHFSLILDGVSYLDSSGLGSLVALQREVKGRSGTVELRGLQPGVRGVIELSRLDRVFAIRD